MATTNAQTFTIGGVTHQVEDTTARAGVSALQSALASLRSALDTLMGTDDITDEIDTYNEIKDFLDGFDVNDPTLVNQLLTLSNAIAAKYTKSSTGIPVSDLAQAVRDLLALAGTAVQPSILNGYVQTSALENYVLASALATVATSGSYNDLTDKPTIPAAYDDSALSNRVTALENAGYITLSALNGYVLSTSLATVATSGSYNDLLNKPTIPAAQVQSDWSQSDNTKKDFIKNKPNLSNYVTTSSLNTTLAGYALKNGSTTEAFNTNLLQVCEENGKAVTLSTEYDDNDDVVILHITSSYGGDLSFAFTGNEIGTIATEEYVNSRLVSMPIVDGSALANEATGGRMAEALANASKSVTIDAGKYYDFGVRPLTGESGLSIFPKAQTEDMDNAYSYVGRFTVDENLSGDFQFALISVRKGLTGNVIDGDTTGDFAFKLPDEVEFEAGHTYEFNILYDVCFLRDITVEEGS